LRPDNPKTYEALARLFIRGQDNEGARRVYEKWLEKDPANPIASHMVTACAGERTARASDDYVRTTFDGFASTFDTVLKKLEYRAPQLVSDAIDRDVGPPHAKLDILDAGCGTGLCAPLLQPHSGRLVGIDLSPRMLDRARARKKYDDLVTAELVEFMNGAEAEYDLIVSADTLVYFGDLRPVFSAAACALRAGGRLVFTVEKLLAESTDGYRIELHGRYSHAEKYVRASLEDAGFEIRSMAAEKLRMESLEPVQGWVVLARLPESDVSR